MFIDVFQSRCRMRWSARLPGVSHHEKPLSSDYLAISRLVSLVFTASCVRLRFILFFSTSFERVPVLLMHLRRPGSIDMYRTENRFLPSLYAGFDGTGLQPFRATARPVSDAGTKRPPVSVTFFSNALKKWRKHGACLPAADTVDDPGTSP